jgi:hypothetical protein
MRLVPAVIVVSLVAFAPARPTATGAGEPVLTVDEMRHFLSTAKVVASHRAGKGVTSPLRLTLSNGSLTHDAAFQTVDEWAARREFADGTSEINFVDSYRYDIAAYALAGLVGLDGMMPVTVERSWQAKTGAISWWVPWKLDEQMRLKQKIEAPDPPAWNAQMRRMRVFTALVYDTDRNLTNVLITEDWKLWMIDFTRAFRQHPTLPDPKQLLTCDRELLARLRALKTADVERAAGKFLKKPEIEALMVRRDRIVELFDRLVAEKGEAAVLY